VLRDGDDGCWANRSHSRIRRNCFSIRGYASAIRINAPKQKITQTTKNLLEWQEHEPHAMWGGRSMRALFGAAGVLSGHMVSPAPVAAGWQPARPRGARLSALPCAPPPDRPFTWTSFAYHSHRVAQNPSGTFCHAPASQPRRPSMNVMRLAVGLAMSHAAAPRPKRQPSREWFFSR